MLSIYLTNVTVLDADFNTALTRVHTYLLAENFGYLSGDLGNRNLDVLDQFLDKNLNIIASFFEDPGTDDELGLNGLDAVKVVEGYVHTYSIDKSTIKSIMGDKIHQNTHLALLFSNLLNENIKESCKFFRARLSQKPKQNMKDASKTVQNFLKHQRHGRAVQTVLKRGAF